MTASCSSSFCSVYQKRYYISRTGYSKTTFLDRLKVRDRTPNTPLSWDKFILPPLRLALKPHAVFPAFYYATQYGFASILPAVSVASIFSKEFKWDTLRIGLGYGGALTIGGSLGELAGGLVLDALVLLFATLGSIVAFLPILGLICRGQWLREMKTVPSIPW